MGRSGFLVVMVTTAACGRVAFVGQPDVAPDVDPLSLHDEDADGFTDPADNCPHLANPVQDDGDGDGVGDLCDPNSATATERIVLFEPFVQPDSWALTGATLDGESIIADTRDMTDVFGSVDMTFGVDTLVLGARFGAVSAVNRRQLSINAHATDTTFHYCEHFENNAIRKFGVVWTTDGFGFNTVDSSVPVDVANQDVRMTMTVNGTNIGCITTIPADRQMVSGVVPASTPTQLRVYAQGAEIRIDYLIQIRTE